MQFYKIYRWDGYALFG